MAKVAALTALAFGARLVGADILAGLTPETDDGALGFDDECTIGDEVCALNALQLRGQKQIPDGFDPASFPVSTFDDLRWKVESNPAGAKIEIMQGVTINFRSTINILENASFEIFSKGAILDGENDNGRIRLFYVMDNLSLSGFVIRNGKTDYAGAVYLDFYSTATISRCNFIDNYAEYVGGAIISKGADLKLINVNFAKNTASNKCLAGKHCTRRRRNHRMGNAVYILGNSTLDATLNKQPSEEDFYFENDFRGSATFHCYMPSMKATPRQNVRGRIHHATDCPLTLEDGA